MRRDRFGRGRPGPGKGVQGDGFRTTEGQEGHVEAVQPIGRPGRHRTHPSVRRHLVQVLWVDPGVPYPRCSSGAPDTGTRPQFPQRVELTEDSAVGRSQDDHAVLVRAQDGGEVGDGLPLQTGKVLDLGHRPRAQQDLVAVAGQFVVEPAALQADVDPGDPGRGPSELGEEARSHEEFLLRRHPPLHRGPHLARGGVLRRLVECHPGLEGTQQPEIPDVTEEDGPARGQQTESGVEDIDQVLGVREVLRHRVDHHDVEVRRGEARAVGGVPDEESHHVGQIRVASHPALEVRHGRCGEVGAPVALARGGELGEQQAVPDTDLQDAPGRQRAHPVDRGRPPGQHVLDRQGRSVVTAAPDGEAFPEGAVGDLVPVERVVELLPGLDLAALLHLVTPGRPLVVRYDVADELVVVAVRANQGGRLPDPGLAGQGRLDLTELDPEPTDLDLVIGASDELQAPAGQPANEIAGAVHPGTRPGERVGHEPFGREPAPPQVPPAQAGTGDVQLTDHPWGNQPQRGVEDVHAHAGDLGTDLGWTVEARHGPQGAPHGGLGGPVEVHDLPTHLAHAAGEIRGQRLPAHQQPDTPEPVGCVGEHRAVERGGRLEGGGPAVGQQLRQGDRVPGRVGRGDDDARAMHEREVDVDGDDVESDRRRGHDPVPCPEAETFPEPGEEVRETAVGDQHTLGFPGRSGGVDDVHGVPGVDRGRSVLTGQVGRRPRGEFPLRLLRTQHDGLGAPCGGGQTTEPLLRGHDDDRAGVLDEEREPVDRVAEVQREIGAARLHHRQHRGDHVGRSWQGESDDVVRSNPPRHQQACEAIGPLVQVPVGRRTPLGDDRDGVRRPGRLAFDVFVRPGLVPGHRVGVGVAAQDQSIAFVEAQELHGTDTRGRGVGDDPQEPAVPLADPSHRVGVEQVSRVLEEDDQPFLVGRALPGDAPVHDRHEQVELGGAGLQPVQGRVQVAEPHDRRLHVLEREHHLEQGVPAQRTGRVQRLDQVLERQVLVRVGIEVGRAHPTKQLAERRVPRRVDP